MTKEKSFMCFKRIKDVHGLSEIFNCDVVSNITFYHTACEEDVPSENIESKIYHEIMNLEKDLEPIPVIVVRLKKKEKSIITEHILFTSLPRLTSHDVKTIRVYEEI